MPRLFIALQLDQEGRQSLGSLSRKLLMADISGLRVSKSERIHLTLRFLGSIGDDQIEAVTCAVNRAAQENTAFSLRLNGVGAFPNLNRSKVLWVGLEGDIDKLKRLKSCIDLYLSEVDFPLDNSVFIPHVTLARVNNSANKQQSAQIWRKLKALEQERNREVPITAIEVIESTHNRDGVTHKTIHRVHLGE